MALVVSSAICSEFISFRSFEGFVFCPPWQRGPPPRRTNALPGRRLALSRARCQGRGVGVHRSEAEILDRRRARPERRVGREGHEHEGLGSLAKGQKARLPNLGTAWVQASAKKGGFDLCVSDARKSL